MHAVAINPITERYARFLGVRVDAELVGGLVAAAPCPLELDDGLPDNTGAGVVEALVGLMEEVCVVFPTIVVEAVSNPI